MASQARKPSVLILGGQPACAQAVINYLIPHQTGAEPLVSYLRVSDKYLVDPPTTYIGGRASRALKQPNVEYRQANLMDEDEVELIFTPPPGQPPFDYVLDCSGEIRLGRNDDVYFETTANMIRNFGLAAVRHGIKAYVRLTHFYYARPYEEGHLSEKDRPIPEDTRGYWWHESLRVLASMEQLPLVVIRIGATYGPQQIWGTLHSRIVTGRIYQYAEAEMKYLWEPRSRYNTVHTEDVANAMFLAARWIAGVGRSKAIEVAGEDFPHVDSGDSYTENVVKGLEIDTSLIPKAPLFNLVDDSDTTLQSTGEVIAKAFGGLQFGFVDEEENEAALADLSRTVEQINALHHGPWLELINSSNPPVPHTPLTSYVELHKFFLREIALTNDKIKRVLPGFALKHPEFNEREISDVVESFVEDGVWPL